MNRYIIPILLVLIATGVYIQSIDPTYTVIRELQVKIADIEAHKIEARDAQSKIAALEKVTKTFPEGYENRLRMMIPTTVDPTRLIIDVNEMAASQGLHLKAPQVTYQAIDAKKSAPFAKHTITFTVKAPYDTFRKFISLLEYNLALRDVTSVSFTTASPEENGLPVAHPETLPYDYSFSITTYSLQ